MCKSNQRSVKTVALLFTLSAALGMLRCTTPGPPAPTPEQVRTRNQMRAMEFGTVLESKLIFKRNELVTVYLRDIGDQLRVGRPNVGALPLEIRLQQGLMGVASRAKWRAYGVLGTRLYLPTALLREFEFENEMAALMAFELALVDTGVATARAEAFQNAGQKSPPVLGPGGIFDFTTEELVQAIDPALDMLFTGGFDPRGLTALITRYQNDQRNSPYRPDQVADLLEAARRAIALRTPLRNPIVRSPKFLEMRKKMQRL